MIVSLRLTLKDVPRLFLVGRIHLLGECVYILAHPVEMSNLQ